MRAVLEYVDILRNIMIGRSKIIAIINNLALHIIADERD